MTATIPKIKLSNGFQIPIIGLGTWKSPENALKQAVKDAVNAGYRHIDCAFIYQNEKEVGSALQELFSEGKVKREELFLTSKLWNAFHSKGSVLGAFKTSLKSLGLAYLDLYLMHWPVGVQEGGELMPKDESGMGIYSDVDYIETWKAMEALVKEGLCRSIGLSNFNSEQIDRILEIAEVKPVINQVECHPYFNQKDLHDFCESRNIVLTAYSPLGSPDRMWAKPEDPEVMKDETIIAIGSKYGKSPAQVCIRYQTQRGNVVIPKSITKSRIEENIQVFDFTLTDEDMKTIDDLNRNFRGILPLWLTKSKYFPFNIPF